MKLLFVVAPNFSIDTTSGNKGVPVFLLHHFCSYRFYSSVTLHTNRSFRSSSSHNGCLAGSVLVSSTSNPFSPFVLLSFCLGVRRPFTSTVSDRHPHFVGTDWETYALKKRIDNTLYSVLNTCLEKKKKKPSSRQ